MPQARSLILATVAEALRAAGRLEEAYDTLARSAQLERDAFHELSQLQLGIERAKLEALAARREATRLAEQAERDHLTGLHNRRYLARELERMTAGGVAGRFSLAVLDLDRFKAINDAHGHGTGDHVLMRVAALLVDGLRARDTVVRTGGEEFVILMPDTEPRAAAACCERLREAIRREDWDALAPGLAVTASIGLACSTGETDVETLAKLADRRLYEAKRAGRDRVVALAADLPHRPARSARAPRRGPRARYERRRELDRVAVAAHQHAELARAATIASSVAPGSGARWRGPAVKSTAPRGRGRGRRRPLRRPPGPRGTSSTCSPSAAARGAGPHPRRSRSR